jgi:cytochrome c biogenesis protein CcmG, thiol:disulfide interchange protein DsbE
MKARTILPVLALLWFPSVVLASSKTEASPPPAPSFSLTTQNGKTVSLESLKGKVVLLDYWASWCVPCKQSFPWLSAMHEKYSAKGLVIVAVNLDKKRELADEFISKFTVPFTVAFDPTGKTADAFKVKAMPTSFLISRTGTVLYTHIGFDPKKTAETETKIQEACAQ